MPPSATLNQSHESLHSYSTVVDQIIALRLQTMAAVYGMTVYVPPATTRQPIAIFHPEAARQLQEADVVLAVITNNPAAQARNEMNQALHYGKLLIPIVSSTVSAEYYRTFAPYFVVDPSDPSHVEREIVKFLASKKQDQNTKGGLLALATLTVALLLFGGGDTN